MLIGHGSFDGKIAAFNLPGPDLTAADYAVLLGKLSAQHVTFVDTTELERRLLAAVAAPGRTIVTATKTGGERNETRFAEYFVEAFGDAAADATATAASRRRSVRLREDQGRQGVRAGRVHPDRARDARGRRRRQAGSHAVSRGAPV